MDDVIPSKDQKKDPPPRKLKIVELILRYLRHTVQGLPQHQPLSGAVLVKIRFAILQDGLMILLCLQNTTIDLYVIRKYLLRLNTNQ
ncbi:hypothetical protein NQ315_008924 [Exocentrus adspersus]|uniref:Uncharacterized protein n=1 Tax=Exocentrus adspersus TaxID=1586481 RepID=A0AAV8V7V7_9CUCU|nr:hypothetical protein NQ315_008924 [Exocentrus adspersus]